MFIINIYNQTKFFHVPEKTGKIAKTGGFLRSGHEYPTHRHPHIYSLIAKI